MGYDTEYSGRIKISPPLNQAEIDYLQKFAQTRHCIRQQGEFYVDGSYGQDEVGILSMNTPYPNQPSLWCNFEASADGTALVWNGTEKTYEGPKWIAYLIKNFLSADSPIKSLTGDHFFTFDHVCNGKLLAQGEDINDRFKIVVTDNVVTVIELE